MRSRKCRTGPSVCGKRPPNSSIYVSTSEVKTTTEGITTLSSAGLPAWESAGCQPHRKTPRSRKFNSTENMKTTSETVTLQQHPQASAERAPRQAIRTRSQMENKPHENFQEGRRTKRAHRLTSLRTLHKDETRKKLPQFLHEA